ncbi:hypothetical protein JB92DRAFT_3139171 [Gautieria morchelliformis]|nr:hypothetical protein JB92DRAFT_3139171 [Gautieria morchelliformis]
MSVPIPNQGDVTIRDFYGNTISKLFQYGLIDWKQFHSCLRYVIVTSDWVVFEYDENTPGLHGAAHPEGDGLVEPGTYIVLQADGSPITVEFTNLAPRPRHPTISNTAQGSRGNHYQTRTRDRDPCCLISGFSVVRGDFTRFSAAHIYPRAHVLEWNNKGYPSRITDPAPISDIGGPSKIDSIQNIILLRSDLHNAWDNYDFAVNPDADYVVIPFIAGYDDIAGKTLKLDHINDCNICPLDELLKDHFLQGVLKHMKGAGEPTWDYEEAFDGGRVDLSNNVWSGKEGQVHFEFEMANRLHDLQVQQGDVMLPEGGGLEGES